MKTPLTEEQKQRAIEQIVLEANAGLIDDETFAARMQEIGATDDEVMEVYDRA